MKKELVIKKCLKCGSLIEIINDCNCEECGIMCCGEKMIEIKNNDVTSNINSNFLQFGELFMKNMLKLIPNSVDASFEKHVPTYEKVEDEILVKVNHVMEKEHYIEWIAMVTDTSVYKVKLYPEQNAECRFKYIPGATLYAYCNKHGLWKTDII